MELESLRGTVRSRGRFIVTAGALGSLLVGGLVHWQLSDRHQELENRSLERLARPALADLSRRLVAQLGVLKATAAFVSSSAEVLDEPRFEAFARPLVAEDPAVYALEWAPEVAAEKREAFVDEVRASSGRADFDIVEPDTASEMRPVGTRRVYFPIRFAEPGDGGLGLDVGFEAQRRAYVDEAFESGEAVMSGSFELAEQARESRFVAAYLAVEEPRGLAIMVLDVTRLIGKWAEDIGEHELEVDVRNQEGELLYGDLDRGAVAWASTVDFADGRLQISLSHPQGLVSGGGWISVQSAAAGLVVLLMTLLGWYVERARTLGLQVERAQSLGQYVVEKELGEGGMGVVFLARHALMKRPTALKLMLAQDQASITRFEREVRMTCTLNHPNIISLYDYGRTDDGLFYYAMEYLPGIDLQSLVLRDGPLPDGRALYFLRQAVEGLGEAHAAGLVHRDVKPGNMVATRLGTRADLLKVLDFGLVRPVQEFGSPDQGRMVGTPLYMAPESIERPDSAGPAADVYAIGCLAFFLLSGRPPFIAADVHSILVAQVQEAPPLLNELVQIPVAPELEAIVARCLAKDPSARPQDDELLEALKEVPNRSPWTTEDAHRWWDDFSAEEAVVEVGSSDYSITIQRPGVLGA